MLKENKVMNQISLTIEHILEEILRLKEAIQFILLLINIMEKTERDHRSPWAKNLGRLSLEDVLSNIWSRCLQYCPPSSSITHDWRVTQTSWIRLKLTETQTTQIENHTCIPFQTIDRGGGGKCWNRVRLDIYRFSSTSLEQIDNFFPLLSSL
jgi:hypothetical protein